MVGIRAQERCERRCGRPGLPVLNSPYGHCERKARLIHDINLNKVFRRARRVRRCGTDSNILEQNMACRAGEGSTRERDRRLVNTETSHWYTAGLGSAALAAAVALPG